MSWSFILASCEIKPPVIFFSGYGHVCNNLAVQVPNPRNKENCGELLTAEHENCRIVGPDLPVWRWMDGEVWHQDNRMVDKKKKQEIEN